MSATIGLQELMFQVKRELLMPDRSDPVPLFYVEGVELELRVVVHKAANAGIKIYVVDVGGKAGAEEGHTVKVALRPLYTREELRRMLESDSEIGPRLLGAAVEGTLMSIFDRDADGG